MPDAVRLDVWLDVACLAKTRSHAKELCDGGKVDVDGESSKPHRLIRPGSSIKLTLGPGNRREVVVKALAETHIPKAQARKLYEDVTPPPSPEELQLRWMLRHAPPPAPPRGAGRPEKRDRRQMDKLRGR
jgi:ribosome-associated heat shock protein Hsp15